MAGIEGKSNEPLDVEATASSSRDRSQGNLRFVEALQTARRRIKRETQPPVELHLSEKAAAAHAKRLEDEKKKKRNLNDGGEHAGRPDTDSPTEQAQPPPRNSRESRGGRSL